MLADVTIPSFWVGFAAGVGAVLLVLILIAVWMLHQDKKAVAP